MGHSDAIAQPYATAQPYAIAHPSQRARRMGHTEFDGWARTSDGTCGSRSLRFGRDDRELRRWRRAEARAVEVPHSCAKSRNAHEWATPTRLPSTTR